MSKTVLVLLAEGCEELEAITIIDLLRRAKIEVTVAGLDGKPVTASRGTRIIPDCSLDKALERKYDMVALPGGLPGADNLAADPRVMALLQEMAQTGKFTCAICAAPVVLAKAGLLAGKRATSYPGCIEALNRADVNSTGEAVVRDGTIITSRGPGTAMDFALELIEALLDREIRETVEIALVR